MLELKSKHNERQEMNQLTESEMRIVTLAMTSQLIDEKEKLAKVNFSDDYTLDVVKKLRELQRVYEKVIDIERQAFRAEKNK